MKSNLLLGGLLMGAGIGIISGAIAMRYQDMKILGVSPNVVAAQVEECELPLRRNEHCEVIIAAVPNAVAKELRVALDDLAKQPTPELSETTKKE